MVNYLYDFIQYYVLMKREELPPSLLHLFQQAGIVEVEEAEGKIKITVKREIDPLRDLFGIKLWRKEERNEGIKYILYK